MQSLPRCRYYCLFAKKRNGERGGGTKTQCYEEFEETWRRSYVDITWRAALRHWMKRETKRQKSKELMSWELRQQATSMWGPLWGDDRGGNKLMKKQSTGRRYNISFCVKKPHLLSGDMAWNFPLRQTILFDFSFVHSNCSPFLLVSSSFQYLLCSFLPIVWFHHASSHEGLIVSCPALSFALPHFFILFFSSLLLVPSFSHRFGALGYRSIYIATCRLICLTVCPVAAIVFALLMFILVFIGDEFPQARVNSKRSKL